MIGQGRSEILHGRRSTRKQSTWTYYALFVEVQPLGPLKSASRKLAETFKLTHYPQHSGLDVSRARL
jgi:hypothetical protein